MHLLYIGGMTVGARDSGSRQSMWEEAVESAAGRCVHPFYERLDRIFELLYARMGRPGLDPGRSKGRIRSGRSRGGRPNPHSHKVEHAVAMETGIRVDDRYRYDDHD